MPTSTPTTDTHFHRSAAHDETAAVLSHCDGAKASQNFSLVQAQALIAASKWACFSKAAVELSMSQPAFSRCIKEMESALHQALFIRMQRGVSLTPAGADLLPHAARLVVAYDDALTFISTRRAARTRTLRLAMGASVGTLVTQALKQNLAGVDLQLSAMGSEEALAQVLDQSAELGLCGDMGEHPDIRYTPLLQAPLGLLVPPSCDVPVSVQSLDDLSGVPLIRLAECTPVTRVLRREGISLPSYFGASIVFTCLSAAFDLMRQQKLATVATGIDASLPQARDFNFVPLPGILPTLSVYLISARKLSHDDEMERLRDLVRQSVHESPWHPTVRRLNQLSD